MSEEWNFYTCNIKDKIAAIFVDLGIFNSTPIAALPFMAYVRLSMKSPDANGMPSREEYDTLVALEEALEDKLAVDGTVYVGRCTTDSHRDFFFYTDRSSAWIKAVADCLAAFPDYEYTADTRSEPDWATYRSYLYPSKADRQTMDNRRICLLLTENGDRLTESREIEHWAYFTTDKNRSEFVAQVTKFGFKIVSLTESQSDEHTIKYLAHISKFDLPSSDNIDNIVLPIFYLAIEHNGEYDGWGTAVVKSASE
jgi:uncharacterized protein (TIGR01619 family)